MSKHSKQDPKGKDAFTNHQEDPLAAESKAEQVTQDGSLEAFTPTGKENDPYYQRPVPHAAEIVKPAPTYGIPAGGISSAPTSHVDPEAAIEQKQDVAEVVTGQSNPDLPGTAADGFQPRAGGEAPAKPYEGKTVEEKEEDNEKGNKALKGNYETKSE